METCFKWWCFNNKNTSQTVFRCQLSSTVFE